MITYEQTDPLFVIDVSNPSSPKISGEVKISGFSTLLVPVDKNTLLGIGYHTGESEDPEIDMEVQSGLKLVTFDVSDKSNPGVLDTKVFENYSSEVQYNPKALLVNFERNDYTVPYSKVVYEYDKSEKYYYSTDYSCGAVNFRVDNGKINIIDNYVSEKLSVNGEESEDLRCVYSGDYIYILGESYSSSGENKVKIDCFKYK